MKVAFIGNARCFHTMDWYRNAQQLLAPDPVPFATDLVESEGNVRLVRATDVIIPLWNIDRFLLRRQSRLGNLWRNTVKTAFVPLQVWRLRRIVRSLGGDGPLIFHAHTMYYMWVCWLAGVEFVGTPQGSEILVRPNRSKIYRYFAGRSLAAARKVTVDSESMRSGVRRLCGKDALVIQNGIDLNSIMARRVPVEARKCLLSIRILAPLYRIHKILESRVIANEYLPLTFVYPQWEENYRSACFSGLRDGDSDLGRLPRDKLYELLAETLLVLSIPESDSSPRSVYEAIFCGCCVAVTSHPWIDGLPACMRARLHIVDLGDPKWLGKAVAHARLITGKPYLPSEQALDLFDQRRSMRRVIELCYLPALLAPDQPFSGAAGPK